jgi:branched-chain amino acid transport system permease protein
MSAEPEAPGLARAGTAVEGGSPPEPAVAPPTPARDTTDRAPTVAARPSFLLPVALLGLLVFPFVSPSIYFQNVLTEVLIFGIFAMSLDLLIGYTGLTSFGHAAFFGIAAYTAGIVATSYTNNIVVTLLAGVASAGLLALPVGALAIRSLGIYFLMLTLAFSQMVFAAAYKWTWLTGGPNGLAGIPRPTLGVGQVEFASVTSFYYLVLAFFVASYLLLRRIVASPLGTGFVGIRENESRMRAIGYNTWLVKLAAFVIAGLFGGLAGVLFSYFNGFVSPSDVYWTTSGLVMVMVIIGGAGTLVGPVLGAALVLILQNIVSSQTDRWPLIMGATFIFFVLVARRGIAGIYQDTVALARRATRR